MTVRELAEFLAAVMFPAPAGEGETAQAMTPSVTLGQLVDVMNASEALQGQRDHSFTLRFTVGEVLELLGEERVRTAVQTATAQGARNPAYESSKSNIVDNWIALGVFAAAFALLSVLVLEFIDKDKR
jgi:hypothetical protein